MNRLRSLIAEARARRRRRELLQARLGLRESEVTEDDADALRIDGAHGTAQQCRLYVALTGTPTGQEHLEYNVRPQRAPVARDRDGDLVPLGGGQGRRACGRPLCALLRGLARRQAAEVHRGYPQ